MLLQLPTAGHETSCIGGLKQLQIGSGCKRYGPTKKIRLIEAESIESVRARSGTKLNTLPNRKRAEPAAKTIPIHQFISCGIQKQRRSSLPMDSSLPAFFKSKFFR
jgi:hypothetical protein